MSVAANFSQVTTGSISLEIRHLRFCLKALSEAQLPEFTGSTLRGAFGNALRRLACIMKAQNCQGCLISQNCAYSVLFETPLPEGPRPAGLMGTFGPHPFVLCPPWDTPAILQPGAHLTFRAVLIGKGMDRIPEFVLAVDEMAKRGLGGGRGRFRLEQVWEERPEGSTLLFEPPSNPMRRPEAPPLCWRPEWAQYPDLQEVTMQFVTPLKLETNGQVRRQLDHQDLLRGLLRRIRHLVAVHGRCEGAEPDFRPLAGMIEEVHLLDSELRPQSWMRWSQRQHRALRLEGLVGHVRLGGLIAPFLPFLALGQVVHAGKATAFGFGRYRLQPDLPPFLRPES